MYSAMTAMYAPVSITDRHREAASVHTVRFDGADWPTSELLLGDRNDSPGRWPLRRRR